MKRYHNVKSKVDFCELYLFRYTNNRLLLVVDTFKFSDIVQNMSKHFTKNNCLISNGYCLKKVNVIKSCLVWMDWMDRHFTCF